MDTYVRQSLVTLFILKEALHTESVNIYIVCIYILSTLNPTQHYLQDLEIRI